jgi:hypothetical protein
MGKSKKSKAGSRMEALAEAVNALSARPLEVIITLPGALSGGTQLTRRLINTVLATDKTTVIKVYREEAVRDDAVPPAPPNPRPSSAFQADPVLPLAAAPVRARDTRTPPV